jgi:hypothetical protein
MRVFEFLFVVYLHHLVQNLILISDISLNSPNVVFQHKAEQLTIKNRVSDCGILRC